MDLAVLGKNIKDNRLQYKLTQAQLAEKLLVSSQAISNWERGITPPDLQNLCKLAELFHISVDMLMGIHEGAGEQLMIGIDGGGTKTEFILFSESGNIRKRVLLSQSNPVDIGLDRSCEVLAQGMDILMEYAPTVSAVFAGIAGTTTGDNARKITDFLYKRYKIKKIKVNTDAINVLSCNISNPDSMAMICGTGSVLFVRINGVIHRVGGWGYLLDESGSAYDIGKDGIRAVLAELDGMGESTLLTTLFREELKDDMWDSLNRIYGQGKAYIASLAPVVFRAASQGDRTAQRIIEKNAAHLAKLVNTALSKYNCGRDVVVGGGLIQNCKEVLLPLIQKDVPEDVHFIFPQLPPIYGACVECCRIIDLHPDEMFYRNFYDNYMSLRS